jgi:cysteine synthase A
MVCAQKGYPLVVTMVENFSVERRRLMRFLGAKVVLTPASEKGSGMVRKAQELADRHGWWQPRQFDNPVNAEVHARTTAREILDAFVDRPLDYWLSGFGTGGTFSGISRVLRARSPETHIVLCEPDNAPLVGSAVPQPREGDGASAESHPRFRPHLMQGWTPDFIPSLMQDPIDTAAFDQAMPIEGGLALQCARDLACREGILAGISAGATLAGALQVADTAPAGSNILCMLPDTGERYLSTVLFDEIAADMTEQELAISESTDGLRFETSAARVVEPPLPPADAVAEKAVSDLVDDASCPVTLFSLEWCEFCWSVKKALQVLGIEYRAVDLDSATYQEGDIGSSLRLALRHRTGWNTFPQVFIGGEFVGGCTDVFDGIVDGSFPARLADRGITHDASVKLDPYSLMPGWLQPRT